METAGFSRTGRRLDWSSRHFCVSATNKVRMLEDGVTDRIKTLLRSDMPPVQFKLLGTLRMMVDGQGEGTGPWCLCPSRSHQHVGRQSLTVGGSGTVTPPLIAL